MDEVDISNFSTSSPHRLPTISAAQALHDAASRSQTIPSSLPRLDDAFRPGAIASSAEGLPRGRLTEVYGPPGVGKTAFAMQLASNALHAGDRVVWIDTGAPLPGPRFKDILQSYSVPVGQDPPSSPPVTKPLHDLLESLTYFKVQTLPHLLVLFLHPTSKFPPPKTALIVVDNVSAPFATAFPRTTDVKMKSMDMARRNRLQWAANRKWAVAGDLAVAMAKMAVFGNIAILVINQVATSLKGVSKAVLKPAISGTGWDAAVGARLVMWRDFAPLGSGIDPSLSHKMRFAEVLKAGGKAVPVRAEGAVPFVIEKEGLREVKLIMSPLIESKKLIPVTTTSIKRKADEIADSEGEGDELGSDDDFGLPDDDLFHQAVLNEQRNEDLGRKEPD